MPLLILFIIILLVIWGGFHLISWLVGGLVDITGGWINLLLGIALILGIWYLVLRVKEKS